MGHDLLRDSAINNTRSTTRPIVEELKSGSQLSWGVAEVSLVGSETPSTMTALRLALEKTQPTAVWPNERG